MVGMAGAPRFTLLLATILLLCQIQSGIAKKKQPRPSSHSGSTFESYSRPAFYHRQEILTPNGGKVVQRSNSPLFPRKGGAAHNSFRSNYPPSNYGHGHHTTTYTCDFPFQNVNGSCYVSSCDTGVSSQSWNTARTSCQSNYAGGDLAVFEDANQYRNAILYLQATDSTKRCSYWIGATDTDNNGVYTWLNGETVPQGVPFWGFEGANQEPSVGGGESYALLDRQDFYWIHNEDVNGGSATPVVALCEAPATTTSESHYGSYDTTTTSTAAPPAVEGSVVNVVVEESSFSSSNDHSFFSNGTVNSNTTHETTESEPINIKIHYPKIIYINPKPTTKLHYAPTHKPHYAPHPQPHYAPHPQPHYAPNPQSHYAPKPQPHYPTQPPYKPEPHYQTQQTHHTPNTHEEYNPLQHTPHSTSYNPYPTNTHKKPYSPQYPHHSYGTKAPHYKGYNHPHSHHHHHLLRDSKPRTSLQKLSVPALKRIVNNLSHLVGKQDSKDPNKSEVISPSTKSKIASSK